MHINLAAASHAWHFILVDVRRLVDYLNNQQIAHSVINLSRNPNTLMEQDTPSLAKPSVWRGLV